MSRRSYYGKTRGFRVILLLPIEIGRIIFLPIDRCGEGDVAGDVEVVGESAAVYLFGQAVVARQLPVGSFFNIMSLLLILAMMG